MKPTLEQLQQQINDLKMQLNTLSVQSQISYDSENAFKKRLDTPDSGVYTPTLTNVANLDGSTASAARYMKIGKMVLVIGTVSVDPTTTIMTQLGISLPISSRFAAIADCAGVVSASTVFNECGAIIADSTNHRAEMNFKALSSTDHAMYFIFMYQIV